MKQSSLQTILLTTLAMIAFASNSLLNRLALGQDTIDAISYTTVRLVSGAVMLFILASLQRKANSPVLRGNWSSAAFLFLYAFTFSLAYLNLSTGTGALILFGSVQITMIIIALWSGERPSPLEWIGLFLALGGLIYLVFPGLTAPSPLGSALMTIAGVAWGFYTLRGRGSQNPIPSTAGNFVFSVPMILIVLLFSLKSIHISSSGILYAVISGAITSGAGYAIWYAALRGLTTTRAATVQLSVPIIAAWSGVVVLGENVSIRLFIAGILILGGIALALSSRGKV
ncbi:MAG TPA: DMT family transporter [Anaerolineales bacterium]|nr:DMT family transporter [Anaerolineales bacterium]